MSHPVRNLLSALPFALLPLTAVAFGGDAELGIVSTSGNSKNDTVSARLSLNHASGLWVHTLDLEALRVSDDAQVTTERYFITGKERYNVTERNYGYGQLDYEDDRFSGYDYRATAILGMGRVLLKREKLQLDIELGIGYKHSEPTGPVEADGYTMGRIGFLLVGQLGEGAEFSEELTVDQGDGERITHSITSLKTTLVGNLATKISLTLRHNSEAVAPIEALDSTTTVTLVYGF